MLLLTDNALWARPLELAYQHRTLISQHEGTEDSEEQIWHATSTSQPGKFRVVTVLIDGRGVIVLCTCPRHQHGLPCKHVAKVLERIEMIPRYAPPVEDVKVARLRGKLAIANLNGDDDEAEALEAELRQLTTV
jgi:hypothetical protein